MRSFVQRTWEVLHSRPISESGYGINTQVEKSKKMTTVNFMGYDGIRQSVYYISFIVNSNFLKP